MIVYLDANVVLDFVLGRGREGVLAASVLTLAELNKMTLVTSPNSFSLCYFYMRKAKLSSRDAKHRLALVRQSIGCVVVDGDVVDSALKREKPTDLEDGMQLETAYKAGADILITNDKKFSKLSVRKIRLMRYEQFLRAFGNF